MSIPLDLIFLYLCVFDEIVILFSTLAVKTASSLHIHFALCFMNLKLNNEIIFTQIKLFLF